MTHKSQNGTTDSSLFAIRLADVRPEAYSLLRSYYPAVDTLSPETLMIDVIDRDDIQTFAISVPERRG